MGFYTKQPDKKSGDGLALTEWNDLSNAVAGNAGLTLALKTEDSVGIGTKEPKMKLHVQNAGAIINGISIGDAPAYATKKEHGYETIGVNDASHVLRLLAPNGLRIQTGTDQAERVTISKDGEVTAAKFIGDGSQITNLSVGETGLNLATIPGSRVGIGTKNPSYKLDVHGGLRVTSGIQASSINASGNITAGSFRGDGSRLSNVSVNIQKLTENGVNIAHRGGLVGIGTSSPSRGKVEIRAAVYTNIGNYGYLNSFGGVARANPTGTMPYSLYAANRIAAEEFNAHSDARIKNIKGISSGNQDLQKLLSIEVTDYQLVDTVANGMRMHKKVIGQQVAQVYPQAVSATMTEVVPDIYEEASYQDGWIMLETTLQVGDQVRIVTPHASEMYEVLEVSTTGFRVAGLALEETWDKVFVYGREVDDFHLVDYEAIAMLNVSATQELYRQLQAQAEEIAALRKLLSDSLVEA